MPVKKKIEVKVVAGPKGGAVTVSDFLAELEAIHSALTAISDSTNNAQSVVWRVVDLHHSDPVVWFGTDAEEAGDRVAEAFINGVHRLAEGHDAEDLTTAALEAIKAALRPIGAGVTAVSVGWKDAAVALDVELKKSFERVSFKNEYYVEEWEGLLEFINVHGDLNTCRLYPISGPQWIHCEFSPEMMTDVRDALKQKVSIYGRAAYRPKERFPHRIVAEHITVVEHTNLDLEELTGTMSAEREELFGKLKQVRDGWH